MRIVVDTNVMVGACLGTGSAAGVIAACLNGQCDPLMGNALFNEYEDVFARRELFVDCRLSAAEREELLDAYFSRCQWTRVYFAWPPNSPDEGDNNLVELAVAGSADCIVTRNLRDLKHMELRFPQLRIVAPETFLKEF